MAAGHTTPDPIAPYRGRLILLLSALGTAAVLLAAYFLIVPFAALGGWADWRWYLGGLYILIFLGALALPVWSLLRRSARH